MKQQRILIVKNTLSKPWDFEAMCLVDDNREIDGGKVKKCIDALFYLFEGTQITNSHIRELEPEKLCSLCDIIFSWYAEDVQNALSLPRENKGSSGSKYFRSLYNVFFKRWGILPDQLGRQKPCNVFLLFGDTDEDVSISDLPPEIRSLYGM